MPEINEIIPGLWLGSRPRVSTISKLQLKGIKAIVTVDVQPLPNREFSCFKLLFIHASDYPFVELIRSFENAIRFIEENVESGVLVHWYAYHSVVNLLLALLVCLEALQ